MTHTKNTDNTGQEHMESKLKYFIYCRKSSEAKDRQALSIEAQVRELTDYAKANHLTVVDMFEESQSAFKTGRPVFNEMIAKLEAGLANAVLTWKPDRLARNARDGGTVIQAVDDGVIREIRTPYECFRQEDNRVMLYIHFGMSNDFSRQISANVKRGNRQKYARGEFCGKAPVGYLNEKVGNSRNITPDPTKAPIIKRLFEECATGKYSVSQLALKAKKLGLTSIFGRELYKSEMYTLLRRTAYYGVYEHGGEHHQGTYEPLVSKALFDRAQEMLRDRSKPRKQDWVHAYKGLVKCGGCGCAITAETKEKYYKGTNRHASYTYYRCTRRRGVCREPGVTEPELEKMLREAVTDIEIDKGMWELGVDLLKAKHSAEVDTAINVRGQLKSDMESVDKELGTLLKLRMNEEITADEYAGQKRLLIDRRLKLKEKVEDSEETSMTWLELAENFFETAYRARTVMEGRDLEAKRDLVKTVGWNLILEQENLRFSFKQPYDVLLQPAMRSDVQTSTHKFEPTLVARFARRHVSVRPDVTSGPPLCTNGIFCARDTAQKFIAKYF